MSPATNYFVPLLQKSNWEKMDFFLSGGVPLATLLVHGDLNCVDGTNVVLLRNFVLSCHVKLLPFMTDQPTPCARSLAEEELGRLCQDRPRV